MQLKHMRPIVIKACHRPGWNARETIVSMLAADVTVSRDNVIVVLDSSDVRDLEHVGVTVRLLDKQAAIAQNNRSAFWEPQGFAHNWQYMPKVRVQRHTSRPRAIYNTIRCLKENPSIVVEDDVMFTRDWHIKLQAEIEKVGDVPIVGYNWFDRPAGWLEGQELWGSQFIYFPETAIALCIRALEAALQRLPPYGTDVILGKALGPRTWRISPSLVQHMGDISAAHQTTVVRKTSDFSPT
jgi:hypothetical protein